MKSHKALKQLLANVTNFIKELGNGAAYALRS